MTGLRKRLTPMHGTMPRPALLAACTAAIRPRLPAGSGQKPIRARRLPRYLSPARPPVRPLTESLA